MTRTRTVSGARPFVDPDFEALRRLDSWLLAFALATSSGSQWVPTTSLKPLLPSMGHRTGRQNR